MKVAYGTNPSAANMTTILANYPNITNSIATNSAAYFTPPSTGVYYFGFNAYSDLYSGGLYLDSITVNTTNCVPVNGLTASNITSTAATINFNVPFSVPGNGYDYYMSTTNTAPTAATTPTGNIATNSIAFSNLNPFTTYFVSVRSNCNTTNQSIWIGVSFRTLIVNDLPKDAIAVAVNAGCPGGNTFTNLNATQSTNEPFAACSGNTGFASVWYKFVAPASGAVKISCDSTGETIGNTKMALFSVTDSTNYATFTQLACDNDNDNGSLIANKS